MGRLIITLLTLFALSAANAAAAGNLLLDVPSVGTPLPSEAVGAADTGANQSISANGQYVVFTSSSNGLLGTDDDDATNVYRKDLNTGEVVLVSTGTTAPAGPGASGAPAISNDGKTVAFVSTFGLEPGDTNGNRDVYARSIADGTTRLVSCSPTCLSARGSVAISGDGHTVAWETNDAGPGDTDTTADVYARTDAGTPFQASVGSNGSSATGFPFLGGISVDEDGSRIAFATGDSLPAELGTTDTDNDLDVYVRDVPAGKTYLASRTAAATPAAGRGSGPDIDDSGEKVVFDTTSSLATSGETPNTQDVYLATVTAAAATEPKVVSSADGQTAAAGLSFGGRISGDGARVGFLSTAALAAGVPAGTRRGYVRTLGNNATTLVTRASGATGAPSTGSTYSIAGLDSHGDRSVFEQSGGGALTPDADPELTVIYRRDTTTNQTANVSRPPGDAPYRFAASSGSLDEHATATSADTRYAVFRSGARGLADPSGSTGVYRRDLRDNTTQRADAGMGGAAPDGATNSSGTISADGTKVAFTSAATNLVPGDTNGQLDAFVHDFAAGTTTRVDVDSSGGQLAAGVGAYDVMIAGNGSRVAFVTVAGIDPVHDTNATEDVYVASPTGTGVQLASRGPGASGNASGSTYDDPSIAADGNRVAFTTYGADVGDGDTDTDADVHVHDLSTGTTTWASHSPSTGSAFTPQLSLDGTKVAFASTATDFGDGDTNADQDVHVRNLATDAIVWATRRPGASGGPLSAVVTSWALSPSGDRLAFVTPDATVVTPDVNAGPDVYVRDLAGGDERRAVTRPDGSQPTGSFFSLAFSYSGACLGIAASDHRLVDGGYSSDDFQHVYLAKLSDDCKPPSVPPVATASPSPAPVGTVSPAPTPTSTPSPARDRTAPALSKLKLRKAKVRARKGTKLTGRISEAARLTVKVQRKRKKAYKTAKTVRKSVKKGALSVTLKLKGLKAGRYRLRVTAKDAAGNVSKVKTLKLRVIR